MLEFRHTDSGCIICGAREDVERMKIVRASGDNLTSFNICTKCQRSMGAEVMEHIKSNEPNGWKQFLGDRFSKVN